MTASVTSPAERGDHPPPASSALGPGRRVLRSVVTWVLPGVALLAIAAMVFPAGGSDDSYITYWSARVLAEAGEILNYNGERVEQSSSLLHTLVLAGIARVTGWSLPVIGHLVAPLAAVVSVVAATALARRLDPRAGLLGGALAATSAYLAYWTFGGLETTLATAVLAVTVLACARAVLSDGRALSLVATAAIAATVAVRPEGGLVLAAGLAGAVALEALHAPTRAGGVAPGRVRAAARDRRVQRLVVLVAVTIGVLAASMALRTAHFGQPFPNPVAAKTGDVVTSESWRYVATWWLTRFQVPVLLVATVGAIRVVRRPGSDASLVVPTLAALTGFVLLSGGDWMQGARFFVPAVPFLAALVAAALVALPWRWLLAFGLVTAQVLGTVDLADRRSITTPTWLDATYDVPAEVEERFAWFELRNRVHRRNAVLFTEAEDVVAQLVPGDAPVTLASVQAGLTVYRLFEAFEGELRFVDRHNLVTDDFGACEDLLEPSFRGLGRKMAYDTWFDDVERCGVAPPDVVIEYGSLEEHPGLPGRYTVVASVAGAPNRADSWPSGIDVGTAQFVAVRDDLLARLSAGTRP